MAATSTTFPEPTPSSRLVHRCAQAPWPHCPPRLPPARGGGGVFAMQPRHRIHGCGGSTRWGRRRAGGWRDRPGSRGAPRSPLGGGDRHCTVLVASSKVKGLSRPPRPPEIPYVHILVYLWAGSLPTRIEPMKLEMRRLMESQGLLAGQPFGNPPRGGPVQDFQLERQRW